MNVLSKRTAWLATVLLAIAVGFSAARILPHEGKSLPPIASYEKMGHLVSQKINVSDVIEYSKPSVIGLPWTGYKLTYAGTKVFMIVRGDCLVSTDLRAATYESTDATKRMTTIVLPTPTVMQSGLIHGQNGTRILATSTLGIEKIILGAATRNDSVNEAMKFAQDRVAEACNNTDSISAAKDNTEKVFNHILSPLNWNANFKWK